MQELNLVFNNYIEEVKKIDIIGKRNELINSIKQLIAIFESMAAVDKIELHFLKNREILDLNNNTVSEDDFIEAVLVYLEVSKNIIGEYLYKKIYSY